MAKFKRRYWVNLSWIKDGPDRAEIVLYRRKKDCQAIMPEGDELAHIEVKEL